jgi:hypothetical protein
LGKQGEFDVLQSQVQYKENLTLPSGFWEYYREAIVNGKDVVVCDVALDQEKSILNTESIKVGITCANIFLDL